MFLINQVKGGLQREVDDFFLSLGREIEDSVTAAAVTVARRALRPSAFTALNVRVVQEAMGSTAGSMWHGLRVLAVDSTTLNLRPNSSINQHFGGQVHNGRLYPFARCSQMIDVGTQLTIDCQVAPFELGEVILAADHVECAPKDSITLYDRGYPGFFLFAMHRHHRRHVVMRIKRRFHPDCDALFLDPDAGKILKMDPAKDAAASCRDAQISDQPVALRLVRLTLPTGETEILATSLLDSVLYPDEAFMELYAQRWAAETDFRTQKSRLQMENLTGKSVHSVYQDVHARILAKNIALWLVADQQERMDQERTERAAAGLTTKHRRKANVVDMLHLLKQVLPAIVMQRDASALQQLWSRCLRHSHAERKGRSFPRNMTSGAKSKRFPMAYKQTA